VIHKIEASEEQSTASLCGKEGQVSEYNSSVTCPDCAYIINNSGELSGTANVCASCDTEFDNPIPGTGCPVCKEQHCTGCAQPLPDGDFVPHGSYTFSNAIGYEIELSPCGESARIRYQMHDETYEISEWCEIEDRWDNSEGHDDNNDSYKVIVSERFGDIPLDQVMRIEPAHKEQ
jgi:hypothetical protein